MDDLLFAWGEMLPNVYILQFTSLMLTQVAHRLSWQGPFVHHTSHLKIDM
jgi:hypothetical protein